ncbi:MAG: hypothetical protein JWQ27_1676 [Ferruginibacter sp.]|nr:hypothetical protein [Ferruginibacter sp.]
MNKGVKYIGIGVLAVMLGGLIYWQFNKKRIVRQSLEKAVTKGSDSMYVVHYDSSSIDALAGDARFYNLVLQSDSLQQLLYSDDTAALGETIFNIHIKELAISGANIPALLQKSKIEANKIEIISPVITIIKTGKERPMNAGDSLAIYERLTGKFKSIQAGQVIVRNGTVAFANGKKSPHTTLQDVSVNLKNLKIDSTRDYNNVISYFVNDVVATVKTVTIKNPGGSRLLNFQDVEYNAPGKFLQINNAFEKDTRSGKVYFELKQNKLSGLSTDAFIRQQKFQADSLRSNGGELSIYRGKNDKKNTEELSIDNEFFNEALIKNIKLGKTTLNIYDKEKPAADRLQIKNVQFSASGLDNVYEGTNIGRLLSNSNWQVSGDGISLVTKDKLYKITVSAFVLNNASSSATIDKISVSPTLSEDAFAKSIKMQTDLYDVKLNKINISGLDIRKLLNEKILEATQISMQPWIHVFTDRTVPPNTVSKLGNYPQQLLQKIKMPYHVGTLLVSNGTITYKERSSFSNKIGEVKFTNATGTVTNLTNIPAYLQKNNMMLLTASTKFLGVSNLSTNWKVPLNSPDGSFAMTGTATGFNAVEVNPVSEPLGMASFKKGKINKLSFDMTGNDYGTTGTGTVLYDNLKITLLKKDNETDSLKKKTAISLLANIIIKDKNPSNGVTRINKVDTKRDMSRSFFNLVWKSLLASARKTSTGKNELN